jgi:hypothetical protein
MDISAYLPSKWTHVPGWSGMGIYQAGGCCALAQPNYGGTLNTPEGSYEGKIIVTFRARCINGSQSLSVQMLKDGISFPDYATDDFFMETINDEDGWKKFEFSTTNICGDPKCFIQFYAGASGDGIIELDDVKVSHDLSFLTAPTQLTAFDFTKDGFTASWSRTSGADGYLISLKQLRPGSGENIVDNESFDDIKSTNGVINSDSANIPAGWTINLTSPDKQIILGEGFNGSQALGFTSDKDTIATPDYGSKIQEFNFHVKKLKEATTSEIDVYGWNGSSWDGFYVLPLSSIEEGVDTFISMKHLEEISMGYVTFSNRFTKLRIQGMYMDGALLSIDQAYVLASPSSEVKILKTDEEVDDTCSVFTGLDPLCEYYYSVKSKNDLGVVSAPSGYHHAAGIYAPTLAEATNVKNDGRFTANWESVAKADKYMVNSYEMFKSKLNEDNYVVLYDDFKNAVPSDTETKSDTLYNYDHFESLSQYTYQRDWRGLGVVIGDGMIGCEKVQYAYNELMTPEISLNNDKGHFCVTLTFTSQPGEELVVQSNDKYATLTCTESGIKTGKLTFDNGIAHQRLVIFTRHLSEFNLHEIKVTQNVSAGDKIYYLLDSMKVDSPTTNCDVCDTLTEPSLQKAFGVVSYYTYEGNTYHSYSSDVMDVPLLVDNVSDVISGCCIYVHDNTIVVSGVLSADVVIYDVSGRIVKRFRTSSDSNVVAVPSAGVYIVKVGNKCRKVVVAD